MRKQLILHGGWQVIELGVEGPIEFDGLAHSAEPDGDRAIGALGEQKRPFDGQIVEL